LLVGQIAQVLQMILITGGAGYVGSHFVRSYLDRLPDAPVVIVDNLSTGHRESLPQGNSIFFHAENIGNQNAMNEIFKRYPIECVIHFAASADVGESQIDPFKYYQNNVVNSIQLFNAMENAGIKKIVFSSTCATYGNPQYTPIDEAHPQVPVNVYGQSKLMLEKTLKSLSETIDWTYVALRYFNAAGADRQNGIGESHHPETHLIPLVLQAAKGEIDAVQINGSDYETRDGTCIRDYIHVLDLATAHHAAIDHLVSGEQSLCVNLGTANGASVMDVINVSRSVTGNDIKVNHGPRRSGDPAALVADYSLASSVLSWRPEHDLDSIISTAWAWEQDRRF
jgi:UDP-glucose 4-epimerase